MLVSFGWGGGDGWGGGSGGGSSSRYLPACLRFRGKVRKQCMYSMRYVLYCTILYIRYRYTYSFIHIPTRAQKLGVTVDVTVFCTR